jgi:hypothetical protein
VFIAVVFLSTKSMYASALVVEPRMAMDKWTCEGKVDDMEKWEISRSKLEKASSIQVNDADIISDLGRIYELKALSKPAWSSVAKTNRSTAIDYHRQATEKRPTWALAWINLAQSKVLNQETDQEAFDAIRNSYRLGRWQEKVQQRVLWLSIGIWPVLPNDIREEVYHVIDKTLEQSGSIDSLILMSFRFGWQKELKARLTLPEHIQAYQKYEDDPDLRRRFSQAQSKQLVC